MVHKIVKLSDIMYLRTGGWSHLWIANSVSDLKKLTAGFPNFRVIGNGSNVIVSDRGLTEAVISLSGSLTDIRVKGNEITAGAGCRLSNLIRKSAENSLSGLECFAGIPAALGGAVFKNAGANGKSICDFVKWVKIISDGREFRITRGKMTYSYRQGPVKDLSVISEICFSLKKSEKEKISQRIKKFIKLRAERGFINKNGTGCIFKNPSSGSAGKMIEAAGLKGRKFGLSSISSYHANVFILDGNKKGFQAYSMINKIREEVYRKNGIYLEPLVEFWGVFGK